MKNIDLTLIQNAIKGPAAAFRCRTQLQPAGGEGDKTFPPTYAGAVYATENRRVKQADGSFDTIPCILLDSVQSQANRMELALQQAIDNGRFKECPIPLISVSFAGEDLLNEIGTITSLEAPHRAADAILRDSLNEGVPFRKSEIGKKLDFVSLQNATPLYEVCPTALIFGIWDSTGPKGGLGAKFQRALVSEIVGINATKGAKTSSRIDPLQIRAAAKVVKSKDGYALAESEKDKGAVSPSEVNHGNIPPSIDEKTGGVTIDYAEQTIVLSLPALRRLKFPDANGKTSPARDAAGQTVLAALAIVAVALAAENGYDLRSRCLLWPDEQPNFKLLEKPGVEPAALSIESETAIQALTQAVAAAETLGLSWRKEPLNLTPAPQLVALLRKSQEIAATEATTEED
ncbi:type I-G CRISPR-associated RAMP protein Csb1/Cas7g [Coraliomargarita sp. W4R53]